MLCYPLRHGELVLWLHVLHCVSACNCALQFAASLGEVGRRLSDSALLTAKGLSFMSGSMRVLATMLRFSPLPALVFDAVS